MNNVFQAYNPIKVAKKSSNIDYFYGPYISIEEANEQVPLSYREVGKTVGILTESGIINEYWYKEGIEDSNLVLKTTVPVPLYTKEEDLNKILKITDSGLTWVFENNDTIQIVNELGDSKDVVLSQWAITQLITQGFRFCGIIYNAAQESKIPYTYQLITKQGIYSENSIEVNSYSYIIFYEDQSVILDTGIPFNVLSINDILESRGDNSKKVLSQKFITQELLNIESKIPEISQELGDSETQIMSQKAVTDYINKVDNILFFDDFAENVPLTLSSTKNANGIVIYDTAKNCFVYYIESLNIYYSVWVGCEKYGTKTEQGIKPKENALFLQGNDIFKFNGIKLISLLGKNEEIMPFNGILDSVEVINSTAFSKQGEVYYVKNPVIPGFIFNYGFFVYKIRNSYYRRWYNVEDYMTEDMLHPIKNRLYCYNNQLYIYTDDFILLEDLNKTLWKNF